MVSLVMKDQPPIEGEFNSPAVMLGRAMFLAMLAAVTAGVLLTVAGVLVAEARLAFAGIATLVLAGVSRTWLQRRGELETAERSLEEIAESAPPLDETRGRELLSLLEAWDTLEQKRGSPEFDPWALQALRNDIRRVVESDPALTHLFTELQKAA